MYYISKKKILMVVGVLGLVVSLWRWQTIVMVQAASRTLTSRVDFEKGSFDQAESYIKEGEVRLKPAGSWGASAWMTPNQALSNGSALVSDNRYTYVMGEWNLYFARYDSVSNKWKQLANAPFDAGGGSDMVVLGDYIYTIFGSRSKQKYFARYSKSANTWEVLPETLEKMADGASLTTDGTSVYCTRGGWLPDFWKYNPSARAWAPLMSAPGNIQQGANLVYKDGNIYTTQGYYTGMFRYNIAQDAWYTLGVSPVNFYENHNVDLVGNYLYVTQDNGSQGFYRYQLPDLTIVGAVGITNGGSGYVAGSLEVDNTGTGGSGLAGTYTVNAAGTVTGITITSIGSSYASLPVVTPRKAVFSVGITTAGAGYAAGALVVNNTGTGGSGFAGTYTVNGAGAITGITITNNGNGYNTAPIITPQPGGNGAVLAARLGSGAILGARQTDPGIWTRLVDTPQATRYVGSVYSKYENLIYVFRGAGYYDFWKYDIAENRFLSPKEHPVGTNSGSDLIYNNGYLYAPRGANTASFYRYEIANNAWTQMADLPNRGTDPSPQVTLNDANRGVSVGNYIYYLRGASGASGTSQQTFVRYNTINNTWEYLADAPASTSNGASLVYPGSGDYIYGTRGSMTNTFWRYSISGNSWSVMPNLLDNSEAGNNSAMVSDGTDIFLMPGYGQTLMTKFNIGTTTWSAVPGIIPFGSYWGSDMTYYNGKIFAQAGNYKKDLWEYTIATNVWRRLSDMQGYGPLDLGPYNGGALEVDNNGNLWSIAGQGIRTLQKYTPSSENYVVSGSWISEEMDLTYVNAWGAFTADYANPNNSSIGFQARVSYNLVDWSDWTTINNNQNLSLEAKRYIQFKAVLGAGTSNTSTPVLRSISVAYSGDSSTPTNPTAFNGYSQQVSGVGISQNVSYKHFSPYFSWSGAADGGSGVDGYYVYFGIGDTADPQVEGSYQNIASYVVSQKMDNGQKYYLRIKTKDKGGNISEAVMGFEYIFGGVDPRSLEVAIGDAYSLGTTSNVEIVDNKLKLKHNNGFWLQEGIRGDATPSYGSNTVYVAERNKMYLLPGRNTREFWEYDLPTNVWLNKSTAPDTVYAHGASLVEGPSGYLYALRGVYTRSFWRYEFATNTWSDEAAADLPSTVNAGTNLVFDGTKYIYAMRANNSDSFYRYDTLTDSWEKMANTDFGAVDYQANNLVGTGAGLAFDGVDTIYATKGAGTNGFAAYSVSGDYWAIMPSLPEMPNTWSRITYEAMTKSIYYMSGYTHFYRYDIDKQTWTQLQDLVYPLTAGSCLTTVGTDLFMMRGGDAMTGKFDTITQTWNVPQRGLFGQLWGGQEARGETWGTAMVKGANQDYYMQRGGFDDVFVKYNADSGEVTKLENAPYGNYHMGKMVYMTDKNKILMTGDYYYRKLFTYDVATDDWAENVGDTMPWDDYGGHSMVYDGSRYVYATRGWGSAEVWKYDTNATEGSRWSRTTNAPAALDWGSYLVKKDNYIYTLRGAAANPNQFYRMDLGTTAWTTMPSLPGRIYQGGWLADGNDGYLYAARGESTNEFYRFNIGTTTWSVFSTPKGPIFGAGAEAVSNGIDKIHVLPGSVGGGTRNTGLYTYMVRTENTAYERQGSYISPVHDLGDVYRFANVSVGNSLAPNFSFAVYTKTSADSVSWSDWELATTTRDIGSTKIFQINSNKSRYIQLKITMLSKDGIYSGYISDYSVNYFQDTQAPSNPTTYSWYTSEGMGTTMVTGVWQNSTRPYFGWSGASDGASGSGVAGYYAYLGVGETADPVVLGTYTTATSMVGAGLTSGQTYYFRLKTKDAAGNVSSDVGTTFVYKFDSELPENPSAVLADPPGYTTTDNYTFSWGSGSDAASGITAYCYKTGATDGPLSTEQCITDVGITGVTGITKYQSDENIFYLRTKDGAGNFSNSYLTAIYKFSGLAPSKPANLRLTHPGVGTSNAENDFAFAWDQPESFLGAAANLVYYYSINEAPTPSNVSKVGTNVRYLSRGEYATRKGVNTIYVVAADEAGNLNISNGKYASYASLDFVAETSAPGIIRNLDISDVSIKETSSWRLALSWDAPEASGSGIAAYKVYKSTTAGASCTSDFDNFAYTSSTTGTSFIDINLRQLKYYFCVKACDSTGECSASSSTVGLLPDGKWRVAPTLVSGPEVTVRTKTALVTWSTNRGSSSFVKYGKSSGDYGTEVGTSDQLSSHQISLTGLDPGTKYYYKVLWTDEDGNNGESDELTFTTNPAPLVSTVKVTDRGLYSAYVEFGLNHASKATVYYGKTVDYGSQQAITTSSAESIYTVKLDNLEDGSKYHLKIAAEDEEGNLFNSDDYEFETLPVPKVNGIKVQQVKGAATATVRLVWQSNTDISSVVTYFPKGMPERAKDQVNLTMLKNHQMIVKDLVDDHDYIFIMKGKDVGGNEAKSSSVDFKTSIDLRAPTIADLRVEGVVNGVGDAAKAQIVINWNTDEPAGAQVEYGEGTGNDYPNRTQEDTNMAQNHVVTIPDLKPATVYHLRVVTRDKVGNAGESYDNVLVTPKATKSALDLVVNSLSKSFGFFNNLSNVVK